MNLTSYSVQPLNIRAITDFHIWNHSGQSHLSDIELGSQLAPRPDFLGNVKVSELGFLSARKFHYGIIAWAKVVD